MGCGRSSSSSSNVIKQGVAARPRDQLRETLHIYPISRGLQSRLTGTTGMSNLALPLRELEHLVPGGGGLSIETIKDKGTSLRELPLTD